MKMNDATENDETETMCRYKSERFGIPDICRIPEPEGCRVQGDTMICKEKDERHHHHAENKTKEGKK